MTLSYQMTSSYVIRTASRVVPAISQASTGRKWILHQYYSSALFPAIAGQLSRNLLQPSSPSFLHHYCSITNSLASPPPGNTESDIREAGMAFIKHLLQIEACSKAKANMDALENELSKIVGMNALKLQLQKWAKGMLLDETRRAFGHKIGPRRPPHMAFLGNPGTGKTMVARLLGKLLHKVGILPKDEVTEVQRTDLVGHYIGETGLKTRQKIQQAEGGILFVDEAYRLVPWQGPNRDYGLEALEEIMSFMDSGKVVVIFAGYSEPMERVISSNEGFRRRVTKFFQFDDFSCEDLAKILHLKMSDQDENSRLYGFKLQPSCSLEAVAAIIEQETTEKQRKEMNGGLVDTLLVNARENLDSRTDLNYIDKDSLITITLEDLAAGLESLKR